MAASEKASCAKVCNEGAVAVNGKGRLELDTHEKRMTAGILLETRDHEIARPLGYASAETKQLDESSPATCCSSPRWQINHGNRTPPSLNGASSRFAQRRSCPRYGHG
jgi:hypothetical protein